MPEALFTWKILNSQNDLRSQNDKDNLLFSSQNDNQQKKDAKTGGKSWHAICFI